MALGFAYLWELQKGDEQTIPRKQTIPRVIPPHQLDFRDGWPTQQRNSSTCVISPLSRGSQGHT
ncbi:hypothetical protein CEXT_680341, partial [Caerostris extrusa]